MEYDAIVCTASSCWINCLSLVIDSSHRRSIDSLDILSLRESREVSIFQVHMVWLPDN